MCPSGLFQQERANSKAVTEFNKGTEFNKQTIHKCMNKETLQDSGGQGG